MDHIKKTTTEEQPGVAHDATDDYLDLQPYLNPQPFDFQTRSKR